MVPKRRADVPTDAVTTEAPQPPVNKPHATPPRPAENGGGNGNGPVYTTTTTSAAKDRFEDLQESVQGFKIDAGSLPERASLPGREPPRLGSGK